MSTPDETLTAVETAVLAVPGVAELYRARPTLGSTVSAVKSLAARTAPSRVVLDGDVLRVVIGTDGSRPAPTTAHEAHVAALAVATEHGLVLSRVDVRVARVG
ncbi:hypothetical protein JOE58_001578 [Curtobacterium luteum]|uniref:Uncharacterized protein n=1 Tax=Curtobacterium luteum TaxID=33881 RepID=A0A8H9G7R5_9MICO|nr:MULTISPECIES: hypothetical protein [Curtobacterium]MBM7802327.1 hypothetical protein [Curtobacterium luteum]NUU52431.1 hypothetical protein [Curtobacterium luteum]GGK91938.1 hypothetical protein GCM10009769_07630 [Curtobacterium luteum]